MAEYKPELGQSGKDWVISLTRGGLGAIPVVGSIIGEIVCNLIPNQRIDRLEKYLNYLEQSLSSAIERFDSFRRNISSPQGIELFEDCLLLAGRASTDIRKQRLARLTFSGLSCDTFNYSETKKMVNLYSELTDEELITLVYYRETIYLESASNPSDYHNLMRKKYPEILEPISASLGQDEEVYRRKALQDSFRDTLIQKGLAKNDRSFSITRLGKILAEYIFLDGEETHDE
nr:hypothetical protein [uncultured Sphaerochaeta sp.]